MMRIFTKFRLLLAITVATGAVAIGGTGVGAIPGWNAGNIMDDAVFTNKSSMSASEIRQFLNAKMPVCDTWGTQPYGGTTRAQYAASRGVSTPFTCLKDYYEHGKHSSQIIYDVAQKYSINPQVLIVLLQKEQALVTDDWPWPIQYRAATGYGCPDTAPCDSQYYGLTNQLDWAAKMFRAILNNSPTWYTPYVLGNNYIQYSPDSSCGGSVVNIQNRTTQALYNYTPYQPNQGALSAGWGTAYCGAYGNRNFYLYFTDWFGSTKTINGSITLSQGLTTSSSNGNIYQGETLTAQYTVSNSANYDVAVGGLGICARMNGKWYDFGYKDQTVIPANSSVTVQYSRLLDLEGGELNISICSYHASLGGWAGSSYPWDPTGARARTARLQVFHNPLVTTSVTTEPGAIYKSDAVTAKTTIVNNAPVPVNTGRILVSVRNDKNVNYDFPSDPSTTIPAQSTLEYTKTRTFNDPGRYNFQLYTFKNNSWSTVYPRSQNTTISKSGSFTVNDNPIMTSGLELESVGGYYESQPITAKFSITNNSNQSVNIGNIVVAARTASGGNVDFPGDTNVTIPAKSVYNYSKTRAMPSPGTYSTFIANFRNGQWNTSYPVSSSSAIKRSASITLKSNPVLTSGVWLTNYSPKAGSDFGASVTIRNSSNVDASIGRLVFALRDPNGRNYDLPSDQELIIPANSTYVYRSSRTLPNTSGRYTLFLANYRNGNWNTVYPSHEGSITRSLQFNVAP